MPALWFVAKSGRVSKTLPLFGSATFGSFALTVKRSSTLEQVGEQGLLGLAFDPGYACNGYFYVWYTVGNCSPTCSNVLERFTVSANDPNVADPNSGKVMLPIPDFATTHNAGMVEFGSDGYLYVSTGDGGAGGAPHHNGQAYDRTSASCMATGCEPLLGK